MVFDNYSLKARVYPMALMFLPLVIVAVVYSFQFGATLKSIGSIGVTASLTFLFSQLGRDLGKRKEPALWQSWGGAPSVQIMRLSNTVLDVHTKQRYHQALKTLCKVPDLTVAQLTTFTELPDDVYKAWTKFLIGKTRDVKKYDLLFKENVSYGFRRNLWGLKAFAITLILTVITGWYLLSSYVYSSYNPLMFPIHWLIGNLLLALLLCLWIFGVTRNWIRTVAFAYAERLVEATDELGQQQQPIQSPIIKP